MSHRERPFIERLRTLEEVLQEVSTSFARGYRFTPVLEASPPRVVSVAVVRTDLSSRPKVVVPASDREDIASPRGRAALRRRIREAAQDLEETQLSFDSA
jgi:hypothetical protein